MFRTAVTLLTLCDTLSPQKAEVAVHCVSSVNSVRWTRKRIQSEWLLPDPRRSIGSVESLAGRDTEAAMSPIAAGWRGWVESRLSAFGRVA